MSKSTDRFTTNLSNYVDKNIRRKVIRDILNMASKIGFQVQENLNNRTTEQLLVMQKIMGEQSDRLLNCPEYASNFEKMQHFTATYMNLPSSKPTKSESRTDTLEMAGVFGTYQAFVNADAAILPVYCGGVDDVAPWDEYDDGVEDGQLQISDSGVLSKPEITCLLLDSLQTSSKVSEASDSMSDIIDNNVLPAYATVGDIEAFMRKSVVDDTGDVDSLLTVRPDLTGLAFLPENHI